HLTEPDAVIAALRTACEILPRDELARSIVSSNRLERAAALAGGAGRLRADKLPLILAATAESDTVVQQAAVAALAHFGEPEAISRLLELIRSNVEPLSSTAVATLAGSRYSASHSALLELLKSEPPETKKLIVRMLAQFPRPLWSEAIYEFVQDSRAGLNVEALSALVQVGHPRLVEVLTEALRGSDEALKQQALTVLVNRPDAESEGIALTFTLAHIQEKEPLPTMLVLLNRVKDRRALPLLLERFPMAQNKQPMIQTLALIGDQETSQFLVEKYPALQNHEKGEVIRALVRLDKPKFRELAGQALLSGDGSLGSYAIQGLQEDGGPESVRLMIDVLAKAENANSWQQLMYALANSGSPQARAALIKARDSGSPEKRSVAVSALQNMRFRSPGFQNYSQAQLLSREQKWNEAIEQYSASIQMDPGFSDSYAERGIAYMHLEKYEEAGKDFSKAFELDPYNSLALTGDCLVLILGKGKTETAIKRLEEHRGKYPNNAVFQYNAGCVYGRAY
ncbi:MAG: tetratricopeptide repeat protein, partial [Planctomycetaceae bacterium]